MAPSDLHDGEPCCREVAPRHVTQHTLVRIWTATLDFWWFSRRNSEATEIQILGKTQVMLKMLWWGESPSILNFTESRP
jgi:hypothetical protein